MRKEISHTNVLRTYITTIINIAWASGSSGNALGYVLLDGPGSNLDVEGVEIFIHSFVSRRVHSNSYRMSTG